MKLSDVVYSITLEEVVTQHMQANPDFMKSFLEGRTLPSMDLVVSPRSINIKREEIQDIFAKLRVLGKL